jgi:hypothetical protein
VKWSSCDVVLTAKPDQGIIDSALFPIPVSTMQTFLMSQSHRIPLVPAEGSYDDSRDVNMHWETGEPLATARSRPPTMSKTMARPGDDDPEAGQHRCY